MSAERTPLPPGPRLPRYVQTALVVLWPDRSLRRWHRRYGDVFSLNTLMNGRLVMLADPAAIKEVFTGPPDVLRAGEANVILEPVVGDRSVLLLDGAEHLRQRRLLLPPFHGERMRAYEAIMREATDREIETWPVGRPFALLPRMQAITLEVIVRAVFGVEAGDRPPASPAVPGDELKRCLRHMLEPMTTPLRLAVLALTGGLLGAQGVDRRFVRRVQAVDELLYDVIARRRAAADIGEREDICSMLLLATDQDGRPMDDREVRDELMTLLVAGHETTATALAWCFERLLRAPGVRALLERELREGGEDYLEAVIRETLRVRPVVANVARVLAEDREIAGWRLPAGVTVAPSISLTHRRADLYPAPQQFRPERFLGRGAPDTYGWLPFGGGPRRCVGAAFAQFEMGVVLRTVLQRTRLEATSRRAEPVKRNGFILVPGRGARVVQRTAPLPAAAAAASARATAPV